MNIVEAIKTTKRTENGDISFNTTGNKYLDILFQTEYFTTHTDEIPKIDDNEYGKLFAMFIRDPRFGIGKRDLGRVLMNDSKLSPEDIVLAGRFDDLLAYPNDNNLNYLMEEVKKDNQLAKKWMPRLKNKDKLLAKALCKYFDINEKEYRKLIKCDSTVEYKLSYYEDGNNTPLNDLFNNKNVIHPLVDTINFEQVPSLAMIKYYNTFSTREDLKDRFEKYLESVKQGKSKLNTKVTNVYDIYRNRNKIDADLFFEQIPKIKINCVPILDTSGSMYFGADDAAGKALSIAHYLGKCSTYCPNQVVSFSSRPKLMNIKGNNYNEEIKSMYTGDCSNTDLKKVMELFKDLEELPEYLVILSDMEFDEGSNVSKNRLMKYWKEKGYTTKIVWWNFNNRNKTVPEIDAYGNIYLSGYSPQLLEFLESNFNGERFLNNLLKNYKLNIDKMKEK